MSPHDIAVAATGFGAALIFVRSYDAARRYRREAAFKRVRAAWIASRAAEAINAAIAGSETKPLNYFERELAEHTCSFGDRCAVKKRAAELGLK